MSGRRQTLAAAAGAVAVALLFFVFVLRPKIAEISKVHDRVVAARQQQQSLRNELTRLKDVRRDAPLTVARLQTVSQYLPSTSDLPGFIRLVQGAATLSGVDLQSIAPSAPTTLAGATGIQTISVTIVVQAGFRRVEDFLARMENLKRIVAISSIGLSPTTDPLSGQTTLASTLTMTMFVVQPDARIGAAPAPSPTPEATP